MENPVLSSASCKVLQSVHGFGIPTVSPTVSCSSTVLVSVIALVTSVVTGSLAPHAAIEVIVAVHIKTNINFLIFISPFVSIRYQALLPFYSIYS